MQNYVVTKNFQDQHTKKYYAIGSSYSAENQERAAELERGGFIAPENSEMAVRAQSSQTNHQNHKQNAETNEAKTVVNGKVVPLRFAQQAQENFEASNNQTGVQAHHDNSSEAVQAGSVAQDANQMNQQQQESASVKKVNVQSGQEHLGQHMSNQEPSSFNATQGVVGQSLEQNNQASKMENQAETSQAKTKAKNQSEK